MRTASGDGYVIRRYLRTSDGKTKWERLPKAEYDKTLNTKAQLAAFVDRINKAHTTELERAKEAYAIKHKFITQEILDEYLTHTIAKSTDESQARTIVKMTYENFLHFFVNKLKLNDPIDWFTNQALWGAVLINKKPDNVSASRWQELQLSASNERRAAKSIRDIVMFSNRFYKWLHTRHPKLFPLLIFEPLTKAQLRLHEGKRKLDKRDEPLGQFIKEEHWKRLYKKLDPSVAPYAWLAYHFGLRAAETLGVQLADLKKGFLHVRRQITSAPLEAEPTFGPLKSRKQRKVYYWFTTPEEAYEVISQLPKPLHPDTLSRRMAATAKSLGYSYQMHDLRRTWITRALRDGKSIAEVRDCAGHSSIETTNRYVMRDEEFDSEVFVPKKK